MPRKTNKGRKIDTSAKNQPCWTCQKALLGCSWSKSFTPVEGWKAIPIQRLHMNETAKMGYQILYCPEYLADEVIEDVQ